MLRIGPDDEPFLAMALVAPIVQASSLRCQSAAERERIDDAMAMEQAETAELRMNILRVDHDPRLLPALAKA